MTLGRLLGGRAGRPDGLAPERTALLVVDMQYFDAHPDWGEGLTARQLGVIDHFQEYFAQIDTITPEIQRLLAAFRAKRMEVIHLRVAELTDDSRDVGLKQLVRGLVVPRHSKEADLLEGLEPEGDEIVISKSSSGVFASTNLDRILRNIGITTLVFTGTSTSGCVQSAVYDAMDLGYRVIVAGDACADATTRSHRAALAYLDSTGVAIQPSASVLAEVTALPAVDPARRSGLERMRPYLLTSPYVPNGTAAEDISPYTLIFGPAVPLEITRASTVLVLIDVQHMTCDPACGLGVLAGVDQLGAYYARVARALEAMAALLGACRAASYRIVHVRTAGQLAEGQDLSPRLRHQGFRTSLESAEAAFMPEVTPRTGEAVFNKPGSGIFTGTGLDEFLRNIGASTLIMAGVSFDGAIEASLRSAGDRGYGALLVPDACVASASVERLLWNAERGIINVRPLAEAVAVIAESAFLARADILQGAEAP